MILKVSSAQGVIKKNQAKDSTPNALNIDIPKTMAPVAKMSVGNLQANFISFTGNKSVWGTQISSAADIEEALGIIEDSSSWRTTLTELPKKDLYDLPHYQSLADNVSIALGPDRSVILAKDEGVEIDLLTHRFARNVMEGNYRGEKLDPKKTEVIFLDAKKAASAGVNVLEYLSDTYYSNIETGKKSVVFVDHVENFFATLQKNGTNFKEFVEDRFLGSNVKFVGLLNKETYKKSFKDVNIKHFSSIDFNGLGVGETKDLFRREPVLIEQQVIDRYGGKRVRLSEGAIDEIIDRSSTQISGVFPQKAFNIMDLVISTRLSESGEPKHGRIVIDRDDVANFFVNHDEVYKYERPSASKFRFAENVTTRMSDVGGLSSIKQDINDDVVAFAKNPKEFIAKSGKPPRGVLLEGPPGNGKTLLARAIAGEAGVPFSAVTGSEFVEMYVGVGAARVREWFGQMRDAAVSSGKNVAIGFIDEIDAIGGVRSGGGGGSQERENTLNQILTEMDGFNKESKVKIVILGATNRKDMLDPALLRRFNTSFEVPNPENVADRLEILKIHTRKEKFASEAEKEIILKEAAQITEGMSGDQIAKAVENAAKVVSKRTENPFITHNDMVEGFLRVYAGPISKSDLPMETKKLVVRHEGGHAVAIDTLKRDKISFITLDGRGSFLGAVFHNPSKEHHNLKSVIYSAAVKYAGGLAEPAFDDVGRSAGVTSDVRQATSIIEHAIKDCGQGIHTPPIKIDAASQALYSAEIKNDVNLFTRTSQTIAKKIVDFHREFLDEYVEKFEANAGKGGNNLSGAEFTKLREKWVLESNKTCELKRLQKEIETLIEHAQNINKGSFVRFLKRIIRLR